MRPLFITGTGTDVGKTLVSAVVVNALGADYWKPVQAGYEEGTDADTIRQLVSHPGSCIHEEVYRLRLPASPHIAASEEGIRIQVETICAALPSTARPLVIEGAGGLLVPLNETHFVADLIKALDAAVILVSRNCLGSINHSLLTAEACRHRGLPVLGWIFTDHYMDYQQQIAEWTGLPVLGAIPRLQPVDRESIAMQSQRLGPVLRSKIQFTPV